MFDPQEERLRVYDMLVPLIEEERDLKKEQIIKKSITIALEELKEFEESFRKFLKSVDHLLIYKEVIRQPLVKNIDILIKDLAMMVERNYTSDELDKMSREVYNQVIRQQKQRLDLLKKIANTYVMQNNKKKSEE